MAPDVLPEERPESRGGEIDLLLQSEESGPLRSGLRERSRYVLGAGGGDLRNNGDRARPGRSRSYGDLDLLTLNEYGAVMSAWLTYLSIPLGGDLALRPSSLLGENLRGGLLRGGDLGLRQFVTSLGGVLSLILYTGLLDRRLGDRPPGW